MVITSRLSHACSLVTVAVVDRFSYVDAGIRSLIGGIRKDANEAKVSSCASRRKEVRKLKEE